jgi:hypothetical protein
VIVSLGMFLIKSLLTVKSELQFSIYIFDTLHRRTKCTRYEGNLTLLVLIVFLIYDPAFAQETEVTELVSVMQRK